MESQCDFHEGGKVDLGYTTKKKTKFTTTKESAKTNTGKRKPRMV